MRDQDIKEDPIGLDAIRSDSDQIGFTMASEPRTGALLRALAASKPSGTFLELGTGTGVGTAWLLTGMDTGSRLHSVETDEQALGVAQRHLGHDQRVTFHLMDGAEYLAQARTGDFDFIFADAWPGKFTHLDRALLRLRRGGIYLVDDLLPAPTWPEGHQSKVAGLISVLETRPGFTAVKLAWASGIMILVKTET